MFQICRALCNGVDYDRYHININDVYATFHYHSKRVRIYYHHSNDMFIS
jgi:hypothetical protein